MGNPTPQARLSPTLWRTCRVLSGQTRLSLLRRIIEHPGQTVSGLAEVEGVSIPRASQELRRLQSRGIVGVTRVGRSVEYEPTADPLVYSAAPLLQAMKATFKQVPPSEDEQIAGWAKGLSHPKRIAAVKLLRVECLPLHHLQGKLGMKGPTLLYHLSFLKRTGWVDVRSRIWRLSVRRLPLTTCMLKLM